MAEIHLKHGHNRKGKRSSTYTSWVGMRERCADSEYPDYGGRGIAVCRSWQESFENFLADMGERPPGTSLDRINNDGNYEPGNCRWANRKDQANNRRRRRDAKLSDESIIQIRIRCGSGESQKAVAAALGVCPSHVSRIVRGERSSNARKALMGISSVLY